MDERSTLEWLQERVKNAERLAIRGDLNSEFNTLLAEIEQKAVLDVELLRTGAQRSSQEYVACLNEIKADLILSVGKTEPDSLDWAHRLDRCKTAIQDALKALQEV